MKPVLYVLDDNGEAYDVRYFCGQWCREQFHIKSDESLKAGESSDWVDGTQCDYCSEPLR